MPHPAMTPEQQQAYNEALKRIEACRSKRGTELDLSEIGLSHLPPEIGQLTALTLLDLAGNQLSSLPPEIGQLTALMTLYLSGNQLGSLLPVIGQLTALTTLDLGTNQLSSLPPEIGQLTALTELSLINNQLSTLPPEIGRLTALTKLSLSGNRLSTLPPEIGQLRALTELSLIDNRLSTLPPEIGKLTALTQLSLSGNQLSSLPPVIGQLTALRGLYLHDNPALAIPNSILGPTAASFYSRTFARPQDILNFYFAQRQGAEEGTLREVNEVKLMLVGRGGAGKTSLRRFFMGAPHDKDEKETPGIALDRFELRLAQREITVRLWDFAGQEITHALHQFFLTEGCIYVLVLDPRSNTEMRDAEYWLGLLNRYAGGAPVLVALNRQDARQGGYDVDRRTLLERFPFIHSFTLTNCEKREGCTELLNSLRDTVATLKTTEPPHLKVPEKWLAVMKDCEGEARAQPQPTGNNLLRWLGLAGHAAPPKGASPNSPPAAPQHLTLDEFRAICVRRGETEPAKQESLARLLHKLGAVLHFVDEPRLRDTTVLNPHWVTDGVYRLLRFKDYPGSDGTLTLAEALQALPGETEETARFFLRLMERFEMCFPLDELDDGTLPTQWLIPGALAEFQPAGLKAEDWQAPGSVRMRYAYDPLPEGVLPRFIVMTHLLSQGQPRWRNGVVLRDGQAAALVRRGEKRNQVEVTAFGPEAERLRLLEIIQGNLERIHADLPDPKPVAELELAGLPGMFRPVADLEAAESGKQQVAVATLQGQALVEPTPQLNQASEPQARGDARVPLRAFLSYSHQDKKAKEIFQQNLTVMTKKKFITQWHDGLIEPGMRWKDEIEGNLARMDLFVGLLTTAFLESNFIETVEIKAARHRLRQQGRDFLFVLILVDDISLAELDLAEYQILKPGGKAVSQHASRRAGFNVAQRELETLLLKRPNYVEALRRSEACKDGGGTKLDLGRLNLTDLPPEIGQLTALTTLDLSNNQLGTLPPEIGRLTALTELDLADNQLSNVPPEIAQLVALTRLDLANNQLSSLPPEIGQLTGLTTLDLANNQLSTLPSEIGRLTRLEELVLEGNALRELPESLNGLAQLQKLTLNENKALGLPTELLGSMDALRNKTPPANPREILDYYFSALGDQGQALREIKVLVVGRGSVGKTSVIRRLKGLPLDILQSETHGIAVEELSLPCASGPVAARVWDFGGQHVLHAMHEFFFTGRSLYVLVLGEREDMAEHDAEYWLQLIRSYAGAAPVVMVLNKSGGRARELDLPRRKLEESYGPILAWVPTECSEADLEKGGIAPLKRELTHAVDEMPEVQARFPKKWVQIKNWLSGMQESYLDYATYMDGCSKLGETDPGKQEELAAFLHDLGVALNYRRDPRLHETTVLRPAWLADGIYGLLRANDTRHPLPLALDGRITLERMPAIYAAAEQLKMLKAADYPMEKHPFLLRLMAAFQLSFPLDEDGTEHLIPALLPVEEPAGSPWHSFDQAATELELRWEFLVVPRPLLPRLLVRTFGLVMAEWRWRRGAIYAYGPAVAKIWEEKERYIYLSVASRSKEPANEAVDDLVRMIRGTLWEIFSEYKNLTVQEQVLWQGDWLPRRAAELMGVCAPDGDQNEENLNPGERP